MGTDHETIVNDICKYMISVTLFSRSLLMDRFDYLVIETSGVSESPESMVRALDKTFGKLTRARCGRAALSRGLTTDSFRRDKS